LKVRRTYSSTIGKGAALGLEIPLTLMVSATELID
jgi:hypothetical protein